MIIVTGSIQVAKENREMALIATRMLMTHSRNEPGNLCYEFGEDIDTPAKFRFYEEWQTPKALNSHLRSEYTQQFRKLIARLGVLSIDVKRLNSETGAIGEAAVA